ncbi:MAG: alpha/beta hydrolase [Chitinophagaceae bacterium]|nr:alpha/beta hydrolase [Chitinophagaceae bacterium]
MPAQLHYTIYGKGHPVLLIHGFGADSRIWKYQIEFLQPHYQIIVPDLRGSGQSSSLSAPISIEQLADDILEILDEEKIFNCTVLGHSMGGYVTLALVEKQPERFNAFGFIHSTSYADTEEKKLARTKSIEFIRENSAYDFLKITAPNWFSDTFKQNHPEVLSSFIDDGKEFSKDALIAYSNAMINRPDRTGVLQKANVPVLYFIGGEDKAVNPGDAITQSAIPALCKVKYLEGIGHMGMLEATEELNHTLEDFLILVQQLELEANLNN